MMKPGELAWLDIGSQDTFVVWSTQENGHQLCHLSRGDIIMIISFHTEMPAESYILTKAGPGFITKHRLVPL